MDEQEPEVCANCGEWIFLEGETWVDEVGEQWCGEDEAHRPSAVGSMSL